MIIARAYNTTGLGLYLNPSPEQVTYCGALQIEGHYKIMNNNFQPFPDLGGKVFKGLHSLACL